MSRFAPPLSSRPRASAALAALAALTAAALLASPAVASADQSSDDIPRVTVHYSLRELATEQGARALYRRIALAAQQVCPMADYNLAAVAVSRKCQRQAIARAVSQIGNARLAAVSARARGG